MARSTTLTEEIARSLEFYWQLAGDTLSDEQICDRIGVRFAQLRGWLQRNIKPKRPDGSRMAEGLRDIRRRAKVRVMTGYLSKLRTAADTAEQAGDFKAAIGAWKWLLEKQFPKQYGRRADGPQSDHEQEQTGVIRAPAVESTEQWTQKHGEPVPE